MGFYSTKFEVLTEDSNLTWSLQSTAVSNVTGGNIENRETMKSMAVTYMHEMVHESYCALRTQCRLSPRYDGKGVKLTVHCRLVLIL